MVLPADVAVRTELPPDHQPARSILPGKPRSYAKRRVNLLCYSCCAFSFEVLRWHKSITLQTPRTNERRIPYAHEKSGEQSQGIRMKAQVDLK